MENNKTEKITINLNVMDLGYIDLLVDEGFYSNRTDLIKTAIRNQLTSHSSEVKELVQRKKETYGYGFAMAIGVSNLTKKRLEEAIDKNKKLNIVVVGMLVIPSNVSLELMKEAIDSIKVYGITRCSNEIKDHFFKS